MGSKVISNLSCVEGRRPEMKATYIQVHVHV